MKLIFTFLLISAYLYPQAQVRQEKTYLLVRFFYEFDKTSQRSFYKIIPDGWAEKAKEIYELKEYSLKRNAQNNDAAFYFERTDTSSVFYNYFRSPTEAFNFLSANGWTLSVVFPDHSGNAADQYNTMVSQKVFCFYKE